MAESTRVYRYRWVVLVVFMLVCMANQSSWINFAPITSQAATVYGTSELMIGLLSMVFMVVYILVVFPSALVIDSWGFRAAVGIGAGFTALGALGRGVFAGSFTAVFICQILIAVGQPLVVGSVTKLAARWFAPAERATAAGLGTLSMYLGILVGLLLTPLLVDSSGIKGMLLIWALDPRPPRCSSSPLRASIPRRLPLPRIWRSDPWCSPG